jgi:putative ABC transport system substrate-binding protein
MAAASLMLIARQGPTLGVFSTGTNRPTCPYSKSTKVEFFINLKTAKVLNLTIPLPLLGRADEVIE